MRSYRELITPDMAAELLRGGDHNRSLNQNWVTTLSRDMIAGRWKLTPQGIVLDEDGKLLDGQHRLSAVVRAKVPAEFWVTEGAPFEMFRYLDGGRSRSMYDRLKISGYDDPSQLAAISRKVYAWRSEQPWKMTKHPSRDELQEIIDKDSSLPDAAKFAHGWNSRPNPATAGFAWWLFTNIDAEDGIWFMERLRTGADLPENSGVWAVRDRLWRQSEQGRFQKTELTLAYVILGWNAYRDNRSVTRLSVRNPLTNENYPKPRR
jgi:hypothetical protein